MTLLGATLLELTDARGKSFAADVKDPLAIFWGGGGSRRRRSTTLAWLASDLEGV
jgi:hypothetical protein